MGGPGPDTKAPAALAMPARAMRAICELQPGSRGSSCATRDARPPLPCKGDRAGRAPRRAPPPPMDPEVESRWVQDGCG
eukprot:scaffold83988_cov28-Tisochrysis_lutea.AAC.3